MKKEIVMASMAMLLASVANAQENTPATQSEQTQTEQQAEKKDGFFKRAFRDMKESARLQHKIDKANYEATKLARLSIRSKNVFPIPKCALHPRRLVWSRNLLRQMSASRQPKQNSIQSRINSQVTNNYKQL